MSAMEVTNASGRKVSLLNDDSPAYFSAPRPRPDQRFRKSTTSRPMTRQNSTSSHNSSVASPVSSPSSTTPQLLRLDSTSSRESLQTPSPMTPTYPFNMPEQHQKAPTGRSHYPPNNGPYYMSMPQHQDAPHLYYSLPMHQGNDLFMEDVYAPTGAQNNTTQYAYVPNDQHVPASPQTATSSTTTAVSSPVATAPPNSNPTKIAKKKYPCPHAVRVGCHDTFTTSGHAARHGKKHTGEKNIHCPTCNKAFTRKDNMKQHERTHKPGKDSSSSNNKSSSNSTGTSDTTNQSTVGRRLAAEGHSPATTASSTPIVNNMDMEFDTSEMELSGDATDPKHPILSRSTFEEALRSRDEEMGRGTKMVEAQGKRPGFETNVSTGSQDCEGESPGLDALAMAARLSG